MTNWIDEYVREKETARRIVAYYHGMGEWRRLLNKDSEEGAAREHAKKCSSSPPYLYWCVMDGFENKIALYYKGEEVVKPDALDW